MDNLGIGVMLNLLRGNQESVDALTDSLGKKITGLGIADGRKLWLAFEDGSRLILSDEGQSCCEHRYMSTDDDLASHVGAALLRAELRSAPGRPSDYGEHEIQFLDVTTTRGVFQVVSHNEHNGYYGGFSIRARIETP